MKAHLILLAFVIALLNVRVVAQEAEKPVIAAETEFRVKLLSPISTETSRKGDKITAQVLTPNQFANYFMEGKVREAKGGKSKSVLAFYFDTLETPDHNGKTHIQSSIKSMANSQGKENVDEEGNVVKKTNNLAKAAVATGAGALVGGLLGGGRGAAIGAGVGAAAALVFIEVGVQAPKVRFASGSEFVMSVKQRQ